LRPGVKFHDGSALTAEDIKYTFDRILDPATKSPRASQLPPIERIEVRGPLQVQFVLKEPFAPFLNLLAGLAVVPSNFTATVSDPRTQTLGTGPYRLTRFSADTVVLERFADYWKTGQDGKPLPYLDRVTFRVIPDPATLRSALRTGDIDLVVGFGLDATAAAILKRQPGVVVQSVPDLSYSLLGLNTTRGPLADNRVRQAISLAVDRQELVNVVYSGEASIAGPIPPTVSQWNPLPPSELPFYREADRVSSARQLLQQAGYPQGFTLKVMPIPTVPEALQIAQVVQQQLKRVGIQAEIEQVDFATFLDRWRRSDFDAFVSLNGGSTDPDLHLYRHVFSTGSTNVFKFKDAEVDRLLQEGRVTTDANERVAIYGQLQRRLAETVPFLWLTYPTVYGAWRDRVQGFVLSSTRSLTSLDAVWMTSR
ncbi:MAG: ABC transporter substrate-binding protein, partial [Bacillota bacterium]